MTTATASVVQVPGQNFVIQQQAPQIFMAPSQAPVVYVPQQASMAAAPMMTAGVMAPAAAPVAAPANLFLPAGTPAMVPAGAPAMGLAAVPAAGVAPAGMGLAAVPVGAAPAGMAVAAAPAAAGLAGGPTQLAAVTNQQLNLPTSGSRTSVVIRGGGLFARAANRAGERLLALGRPRIRTVQETTLNTPLSQAGAPGMTTISTTSAVPLPQPTSTPSVLVPSGGPSNPPICREHDNCRGHHDDEDENVTRPTPQYSGHFHKQG
jgi:hypothetical protein